MDWLTFIANMTQSLAWPAAVILLVFVLKDEIAKIMPSLKRLKAGPVEAEFEREIKQLQEEAGAKRPALNISSVGQDAENLLFQLAEFHPRSAILESWAHLEAAAREALINKSQNLPSQKYIPAAALTKPLSQAELLSDQQLKLYHELRRLRNEVAHSVGFEPTETSARSYIDLASSLQSVLESGGSNA